MFRIKYFLSFSCNKRAFSIKIFRFHIYTSGISYRKFPYVFFFIFLRKFFQLPLLYIDIITTFFFLIPIVDISTLSLFLYIRFDSSAQFFFMPTIMFYAPLPVFFSLSLSLSLSLYIYIYIYTFPFSIYVN